MHKIITDIMMSMADEKKAILLARYFKTGKGQYGDGDKFLGIKVPETRKIVKEYKSQITRDDISPLLSSSWHEIRFAGFLFLIEIFKKYRRQEEAQREIIDYYLDNIQHGNNWDLVDMVAPKLLGEWLITHPAERHILYDLASPNQSLWHNRVAIVATWTLIRNKEFTDSFHIIEQLLNHPHDLIHKACGWMLREIGKRDGIEQLTEFLNSYAVIMPRTMLRYAIEKFPENQRQYYLSLKKV